MQEQKEQITISKKEYTELLSYKQAFTDAMQLKKGVGAAYNKYSDTMNMLRFFERRYGEMYKQMVKNYIQEKNLSPHS